MNNKRGASSPQEGIGKKNDEKSSPSRPQGFLSKFWPIAPTDGADVTGHEEGSSSEESVRTEIEKSSNESSKISNSTSNWLSQDARRSQYQNNDDMPIPSRKWTEPKFSVLNEGPIRQVLEVEIRTLNGKQFRGTVTPQEAKHKIFRESLGFEYSNFYGVRPGWKGVPTMTFTFCEPTNVDDLHRMQDFVYERKTKSGKETITETVGCHIKGLRSKQEEGAGWEPFQENWMRVVKVEGCDYQITNREIMDWLSLYGEVLSPVVEDCFEDSEVEEGVNATGIYSVKMRLKREIPQLLPMCGKRIKVYYKGIDKLCTQCFGKHPRRVCKKEKIPWIDYVQSFIQQNPDIPEQAYGRWVQVINKEKQSKEMTEPKERITRKEIGQRRVHQALHVVSDENSSSEDESEHLTPTSVVKDGLQRSSLEPKPEPAKTKTKEQKVKEVLPTQSFMAESTQEEEEEEPWPSDFNCPADDEEMETMIASMALIGIKYKEAETLIKARKKEYSDALKKFKKKQPKKESKRGRPRK